MKCQYISKYKMEIYLNLNSSNVFIKFIYLFIFSLRVMATRADQNCPNEFEDIAQNENQHVRTDCA